MSAIPFVRWQHPVGAVVRLHNDEQPRAGTIVRITGQVRTPDDRPAYYVSPVKDSPAHDLAVLETRIAEVVDESQARAAQMPRRDAEPRRIAIVPSAPAPMPQKALPEPVDPHEEVPVPTFTKLPKEETATEKPRRGRPKKQQIALVQEERGIEEIEIVRGELASARRKIGEQAKEIAALKREIETWEDSARDSTHTINAWAARYAELQTKHDALKVWYETLQEQNRLHGEALPRIIAERDAAIEEREQLQVYLQEALAATSPTINIYGPITIAGKGE